jgi:hypothetical protein
METKLLSERDEYLIRLRPTIETAKEGENEIEAFQNITLRPVLKFQNGIIMAQFSKYIKKFKPTFNAYNRNAQIGFLEDALKKDPRIRNSMIASVVSMMTLIEYEYYCDNKNEVNKRIISLIIKRIQDQIEMIY